MKLKGKMVVLFPLLFILFTLQSIYVNGETNEATPRVLVVYSSNGGEIDEHQRMLDMLIGHFTEKITFKKVSEVEKKDFDQLDYLFYYGQQRELLTEHFVDLIASYDGPFVAIGHNANQLGDHFNFFEQISDEGTIRQINIPEQIEKTLSFEPQSIIPIKVVDDETKILLMGKNNRQNYPLFLKHKKHFYFASNKVMPPFSIPLAEMLHEVFVINDEKHHQQVGYIRLEDIHPLVNPEDLMAIGQLLAEKNFPYLMAVIPVYINPETKEEHHFSDSPELLKTLKYMQNHGGSIVLHGYTHQFRLSETGEGFEFWDVENNTPIYHGPDEKVEVKTLNDFNSEEDYRNYENTLKAYEKQYIEDRLTKGIQELANYGLYPLAFEAPHYTMSQHGYEVTSQFFSTYVGQLQLSDTNWKVMESAPYISTPSFLNGMTLLPETIGYINPEEGMTIDQMMEEAKKYEFVRDGMIAAFYHPYLGVELFEKLIEQLEKLEHVSWIDLKQTDSQVQAEHVEITAGRGKMVVDMNQLGLFQSSGDYFQYHFHQKITIILWGMAGIGATGVLMFIVFLIVNRIIQYREKRGETIG